jgi:hypothetical protein
MMKRLAALFLLASVALGRAADFATVTGTFLSGATSTVTSEAAVLSVDAPRFGMMIVVNQTGTVTSVAEVSLDGGTTWGVYTTITGAQNAGLIVFGGLGKVRVRVTTCTGCNVTATFALGNLTGGS